MASLASREIKTWRDIGATEKKNGRKERKGRKKELGFVGAGLKPALFVCARRPRTKG